MTMRELAEIAELARERPREAAKLLCGTAPPDAIELLMDAAAWRDDDVADFERCGFAVLIDHGRWGQFWLASPTCKGTLLPPGPRLAPSGLVALARATVDALAGRGH